VLDVTTLRADGSPERLFTHVAELAVGTDGTINVVDGAGVPSDAVLKMFDPRGELVRGIGRKGQGPGEYSFPMGLHVLPDGRLIVASLFGQRLNTDAPDGVPGAMFKFPPGGGGAAGTPGATYVLVDTAGFVYLNPNPDTPNGFRGRLRLGAGGTVIDWLAYPDLSDLSSPLRAARASGSGTEGRGGPRYRIPFAPEAISAWSPAGYFVTSYSARYAIDLRIPPAATMRSAQPFVTRATVARVGQWRPGDRVVSLRPAVPAIPVAVAERDDQRVRTEAQIQRGVPGFALGNSDIPAEKPVLRSLFVSDDCRIWVLLSTAAIKPASGVAIAPPVAGPGVGALTQPPQWIERMSGTFSSRAAGTSGR
jgi:hypothetical protein